MQISAGTMTDGNTGANLGNFLQMIQTMNSGQTTQSGSNLMNLAAGGEDGNAFSQILLQQISLLLQLGGVDLSDTSASTEELLTAIEKLLEQDQSQNQDALNGLAFLAFAGQQFMENASAQSNATGDSVAAVAGDAGLTVLDQTKGGLPAGQLTSVIIQAIKDHLQETSAKGDEKTSLKTGLTTGEGAIGKAAGESATEGMKDPGKAGAAFSTTLENLLKNENGDGDVKNIADLKNASSPEKGIDPDQSQFLAEKNPAAKADGSADQMNTELKKATAEAQVAKTDVKNADVESRLGKDGINIKTLVSDQKIKGSVSEGGKSGDDRPQVSSVSADGNPDAEMKKSSDSNAHHGDRNMESAFRDTKTGTSGKNVTSSTTAMTGTQDAADRIKSEFKGKAGNVEKTAENDFLSSTTIATGTSKAGEKGDVSASSIVNRVAAELRENMMNEGGRVKITLTPPSLGSLEMDVSVQNSRVRVMLIAENKDVQKILSGNIETLKTTLQTQGLTIERCDVMMQDSREEYPQGFNGQQAFGHDSSERERNSRPEILDDKPSGGPSVIHAQTPVRRPQYTGSESISLFA